MEDTLWTNLDNNQFYSKDQKTYYNHILEQYKIYVEMADRISSRRNLANIFFLTLHTTILGVIGFTFEKIDLINPKWMVVFPFLGIITLCIVWWWLLISYRQLNTAKYKVIGDLEKKLPASPYWAAEWKELGEGKSIKKYLPLTALEIFIPIVFGTSYLMILLYLVFFVK